MNEFQDRVCGIPCIIRVLSWDYYTPAKVNGPPEYCYPEEGGDGEWEVLDRRGRPAPWLEAKLANRPDEMSRLNVAVFRKMESRDDL